MPLRCPLPRRNLLRGQVSRNRLHTQPLLHIELKNAAHNVGFLWMYFIPGLSRSASGNIDIAIGSARSHTDLPLFGFMEFAAPAAFQDLCTLELGNHSLHLQQQVILGRVSNGAIDEDDLHPQAMKFLNEHEMMGMVAG